MSEQLREQLSALLDGELPRDELRFLLRRLDADADSMQCWSRYQFASGVLRRQVATPLRVGFAEALMLRLAHEPRPVGVRRGGSLLRWAGGGAIAAAVAVVALVSTRPAGENPSSNIATTIAIVPAARVLAPQDPRPTTAPLPALANFDYAQPASFDTGVVPMPRYDLRRRYDAGGVETLNGFVPYVLLREPVRAPQALAPANPARPPVQRQK